MTVDEKLDMLCAAMLKLAEEIQSAKIVSTP
jgi:hypothetical protein